MTISLKSNAAGTQGEILLNGQTVEVLTASGMPFCKNKLFNGEVTRINQRGFNGDWSAKNVWAGGNTIAQQELCYGYDMWARWGNHDFGSGPVPTMVQWIEEGNYRPSTVHTISYNNGVLAPITVTSPASGNWNILAPQTARNVQVEEGTVATPFEVRPIGFELAQCQRYYALGGLVLQGYADALGAYYGCAIPFTVPMRTIPQMDVVGQQESVNVAAIPSVGAPTNYFGRCFVTISVPDTNFTYISSVACSAVI